MAGYLIADVEVTDPTGYEEYARLVPATVAHFGGKYLLRAASYEKLEGEWAPKRLVVIEFESAERAKEWYDSPEYAQAKLIRQKTAKSNLIIADGG